MLQVGSEIYRRRRQRGITQQTLAQRAQIAQPNLSEIEQGKRDMTIATLERIATALSVTPAELLTPNTPPHARQTLRLTRNVIERISRAIVHNRKALPASERRVAGLIRTLLPSRTQRKKGASSIREAWLSLRAILNDDEIQSILDRVHDEASRST
jgi:transcriptional regulator with XRE-family HTH domain